MRKNKVTLAQKKRAFAKMLEALHEAREQVSILQGRLGIVDTGSGTLSIIDAAIAEAEGRT